MLEIILYVLLTIIVLSQLMLISGIRINSLLRQAVRYEYYVINRLLDNKHYISLKRGLICDSPEMNKLEVKTALCLCINFILYKGDMFLDIVHNHYKNIQWIKVSTPMYDMYFEDKEEADKLRNSLNGKA